jgi:hypothetical protein
MAIDWGPIQTIVDEQAIQQTGRQAELIKFTDGGTAYDPTRTEQAPVDIWITESKRSVTNRNADIVAVGDRVFLVSPPADGSVPEIGDVIRDDADYQIKDVQATRPGDTTLLYKILAGR